MSKPYAGKPEKHSIPMILEVSKSLLLETINRERQRTHQDPIPVNHCEVTVRVPGGGDWSNTDLDLNDQEQVIQVRWKE